VSIKIPAVNAEVCCEKDADNWQGVIVRAATWRKVLAVLKAAEAWGKDDVGEAVNALRKHLERK